MRLRQLNIVSMAGLLAVCVALVGVMGWGLQRLASNASETQHYFDIRERVGGALRAEIETYLHSGDAEQLAASIHSLDAVVIGVQQFEPAIAEPLLAQLADLRQRLDGEMRAAGKLAGNPQALLLQAEAELRDNLATLGQLVEQADAAPDIKLTYLSLVGELSRAVHDLAVARERFAQQGGKSLAANVRFRIAEGERLIKALQALPVLGIAEQRRANAFESLLWSNREESAEAADRSARIREELGFVLGRYPGVFDSTQAQSAAVAAAVEGVRARVAAVLETLAGAEATLLARQQAIRTEVQWTLLSLVLLVAGIGCLLYGVQRHLGSTLILVAEHLRRLADGDLGAHLNVRSPVGEVQALRDSTERLQQVLAAMIGELQQRSLDIGEAGSRVLASAYELDESQSRQRDRSAEAAGAVTEMAAASERVATAAAEVATTTELAAALIAQNSSVIDGAVQSVDGLGEEVAATSAALLRLRDDAEQVQAFVSDIRSIADRTNLLALNAAIEAARAGEQGRGFAVVADEVRQLAARSSEASSQIADALAHISDSSSTLADALARQQQASRDTAEAARTAGSAQRQLVAHVSDIRAAVAQIAAQAQGQYEAVTEVTAFVDSVVVAASSAAAQSADSVRLSQALQGTGQQVALLAGRFQLG